MTRARVARWSVTAAAVALVMSGCTSSHPRSSSASADASQLPPAITSPAGSVSSSLASSAAASPNLASAAPSSPSGTTTTASPPGTTTTTTTTRTPTATPSRRTPSSTPSASPTKTALSNVPRFAHIVVVVLENHPYGELIGTSSTPFLTSLASAGAVLTQSYAITHPSEPNYLALFSGSTQGLSDDSCPHAFSGPNLGSSLLAAHDTFTGYSESLPSAGYTGCSAGAYARKHNPWVNYAALPAAVNQPMTAFPANFAQLPDLAFVVPNLNDDMHDGTIAEGDQWMKAHLSGYVSWMKTHNSLLIVTTDEDDRSHANHITTIMVGAHVKPGTDNTRTNHYGVLRTLLDSFGLSAFAGAATAAPITGFWTS
jgi:phosphatidylinositol-3-phosphatase